MPYASVSREVNERIREVVKALSPTPDGWRYHFLCVCGCFEQVEMTIGEFDASSGLVLIAGHLQPAGNPEQPAVRMAASPEL